MIHRLVFLCVVAPISIASATPTVTACQGTDYPVTTGGMSTSCLAIFGTTDACSVVSGDIECDVGALSSAAWTTYLTDTNVGVDWWFFGTNGTNSFCCRLDRNADGEDLTVTLGPDDDTYSANGIGTAPAASNAWSADAVPDVDVFGLGGDDTMIGSSDVDLEENFWGGDDNDVISSNAGVSLISGDAGNDTLNGGANVDVVMGGDGNDIVNGFGDDDFLYGDDPSCVYSGNDRVEGQDGNDSLEGCGGDDVLEGHNGDDVLCDPDNAAVAGDYDGNADNDTCATGTGHTNCESTPMSCPF
jgi:Ca2+-binding RTX toxin-like protein